MAGKAQRKKSETVEKKGNFFVLLITTVILIALEIYSLKLDSHYKYDFIFLMVLLYGLYHYRSAVGLHPFHYGLFAAFLLLHNLGVFDLYTIYPLGIEYDYWVHGFFGLVSSLILFRFYNRLGFYRGAFKIIAIITVLLGFSALHELYEYAGALVLGEGEGVLFIGAGDLDEWDTQNDMLNNMIGGALGLVLYGLWNAAKGSLRQKGI